MRGIRDEACKATTSIKLADYYYDDANGTVTPQTVLQICAKGTPFVQPVQFIDWNVNCLATNRCPLTSV